MDFKINQLFHPAFIFSLFLLIINDAFLKWQFPSWFTGKLSDFAGLFAFAFFVSIFFQKRKNIVYVFIAILFIWWKSSWSQNFIDLWNKLVFFPVHRVIDYTDLIALIILPIGYFYSFKKVKINYPTFIKVSLCCIVVFSFTATSIPRKIISPEGHVAINKSYSIKKTKDEIFTLLDSMGFEYSQDSMEMQTYGYVDNSGFSDTTSNFDRKGFNMGSQKFVFYNLKNVKFEKAPLLKEVSFHITNFSDNRECIIRFFSITFDERPHQLDNWKKIKQLRRFYKRLLKKKVIKKLRE